MHAWVSMVCSKAGQEYNGPFLPCGIEHQEISLQGLPRSSAKCNDTAAKSGCNYRHERMAVKVCLRLPRPPIR